MLTSSTSQDEIDVAYSLGANAYFRKPMSLESYMEVVDIITRHWLDLAQLSSPGRPLDPGNAAGIREELQRRSEEDPI